MGCGGKLAWAMVVWCFYGLHKTLAYTLKICFLCILRRKSSGLCISFLGAYLSR